MDILKRLPISMPRPRLPGGCELKAASGRLYRPHFPLGEGAAGVVYAGQIVQPNSSGFCPSVAIKVLSPLQRIAVSEAGYDRIKNRFQAESRRGRNLFHPNLCKILDYG